MMQEMNYIRCGDYYIPDIRLPEENRPIGRWGRMHRDYIKEHNPICFNDLCLNGKLWTYLADLNEQAQSRLELVIEQMKASEGVTEDMKKHDQMAWVRAMNSIRNRAEEIILREKYFEDGERKRRTHRLCAIAGTLESIAPAIKELDITEVMELLEHVFHKEEIQKLVHRMKINHDSKVRRAKEG